MIAPEIRDDAQKARLAGMEPDGLTVFTLEGDSIRGALVTGTAMISLMAAAHELGPLETMTLGQAYLAAALLSSTIKGGDRLALRAEGSGPAGGFSVECDAAGSVRGRLFNAPFDLSGLDGRFESSAILGPGSISITRYPEGRGMDPVTGTAAARSGRLAEDLAYFFHVSEQLRTSFSLSVQFDGEGRPAGAAGLYLQALPFASAEALDRVERLVYGLPSLGDSVARGMARRAIAMQSFAFFDLNLLGDGRAAFACPCERDRLRGFLSALPPDELADLKAKGPFPVELRCHNCNSVYRYKKHEIESL